MPGLDPISVKRTDKGQAAERTTPLANAEFNDRQRYTQTGNYSFGRDGGVIGSFNLKDDAGDDLLLPDDAVITRSFYNVEVTCTSAGDTATIAISIPVDDVVGIVAAVAIESASDWDAGFHEGIQIGTVATFSNQLTAARSPTVVVAVQNLTAGEIRVFFEYVINTAVPAS